MKSQRRILLIDHDPAREEILREHLTQAGFVVVGEDARADAAVVADAAECRRLKTRHPDLPVLLLTATPEGGADAVLPIPVRLAALVAVVEDLAGRPAVIRLGPWRFDPAARLLHDDKAAPVRLTEKETAILCCLLQAQEPVPRAHLLAEVWGYAACADTHTLETHVYRLRRKLNSRSAGAALLVSGADGYRLERGQACPTGPSPSAAMRVR